MIGSKSGPIGKINSKTSELNLSPPIGIHCIVHQQALCGKVLDLENVMSIVVQIINFIRSHRLNHRQFQNFLSEIESEYKDVLYQTSLQLEIIELQSNNSLRTTFNNLTRSQNLFQFYSNLSEEDFPNVRKFAAKMSCIFGSTHICEQVFSTMKINKKPNINVLCQQKQAHSSH
ncbi:unnamed protein product [Macrosiphum euphorbiae]|uniref:General transcription factor II-I repeat domain-containing protein 2 n=1 Tax=Macrosiphum euphorbiae TaxID=13131 RepID=A0AAV0XLQ1_9HEMI|nr:unnamed protein product [Macrosiphum euphorbiae]